MTSLLKNSTPVTPVTPVTTGTIVRIWHDSRGHDYVVMGRKTDTKQVMLLKHNCINNDGSIHASTIQHGYISHKELRYTDQGIVQGVRNIVGCMEKSSDRFTNFVKNVEDLWKDAGETAGEVVHSSLLGTYATSRKVTVEF